MHLFTGEFDHKIDQKGRIFVPKRLLDSMDCNLAQLRFVITLGLDGCLYLFTRGGFKEHLAGLRKAAFGKSEYRAVMRGIGALSLEQSLDSQGRLLIPEELRRKAGLQQKAVVIGAIDHIEVWDAQRYREEAAPEAEKTYLKEAEQYLDGSADHDGDSR
jgi:transcriptional regulator MraZ